MVSNWLAVTGALYMRQGPWLVEAKSIAGFAFCGLELLSEVP